MKIIQTIVWMLVIAGIMLMPGCRKTEPETGGNSPAEAQKAEAPPKKSPAYKGVIVALGDSLTEGYGVDEQEAYPALLEKKLHEAGHQFKVVNAGISGETSSGALSRLNWVVSSLKPDIVIVETGANDGLRGIDPQFTKKNISEIVRILKEKKIGVVLVGMKMVRNMGKAYTDAFESIYSDIAKEEQVIFMPFFLEGVAGDAALNQGDGIHPTAEGYRVITEKLEPYVLEAIGFAGEKGD